MNDVTAEVRYIAAGGATLAPHERAALAVSLPLLKHNAALSRVVVWGKILGVGGEYLLAQGFEEPTSIDVPRRLFVSTDGGVQFELVPPLSDLDRHYCAKLSGLLNGQRDYAYLVPKDPAVEPEEEPAAKPAAEDGDEEAAGDDAPKASKLRRIDELTRVAYIVELIDRDTAVVPRGAFVLDAHEHVARNRAFEGLSRAEAGKLRNYVHFRAAEGADKRTLLEREHLSASLDFLDFLTDDVPRGCWSLQFDSIANAVSLRSLVWPGYVAYHVPDSHVFGGVYIGNGQKNADLGFML